MWRRLVTGAVSGVLLAIVVATGAHAKLAVPPALTRVRRH